MKTKLFTIILAIAGLVSCQNHELFVTADSDAEYVIEITYENNGTKSTQQADLGLADLDSSLSKVKKLTAALKQKDGQGGYKDLNKEARQKVVYRWESSGNSRDVFTYKNTLDECMVTAVAEGDGVLDIFADIDGNTVAVKELPVTVSDNRTLFWSDVKTLINSGETNTATLNSNFKGTITVSSSHTSLLKDFLVGTDPQHLSTSADVSFSNVRTQTVYYKYVGTSSSTIDIEARCGGINTSASLKSTGKKVGLFYALGGTTWKSMDARGTYSSKHKINTSAYAGECYYCDFHADVDYLNNGACTPDIRTDEIASFVYYDNDGVEQKISVSASRPTCIVDNMNLWNRTESAYPYKDGKHFIGSHTSYVTITVTLPDSTTQTYWGYITETDNFGDLCHFYTHYSD